jgi:hypothetical protein
MGLMPTKDNKKEPEWKCEICKKPKTIIKKENSVIIGCEHLAILKVKGRWE